jgi:hypothetical protein
MQIQFSDVGGDFPYKAHYVGYQSASVNPRLGMGGITGHATKTYGQLLEHVLADLRCCPEPIEPTFSDNIRPEIQEATRLLLKGLKQNSSLEEKIRRAREILSE